MKRTAPLALIAIVLAACGSGDDASVDNVWARESAPTQTSGAIYFDLIVAEDDTLIAATVPASVASSAEIHEVVASDTDMSDDMEMSEGSDAMDDMEMSEGSSDMDDMEMDMSDGAMMMQELPDGLPLTADETVSFAPGGYHVMMPELAEPLEIGDEFELTLEFANADDLTVNVEVLETAP